MTPRAPTSLPQRTQAAKAMFLIAGGIIAAAQLGKIIVAMPLIQAELRLGLGEVSLLIAVFATLGSLFGLGAGVIARRFGARRSLVGGMLAIAAASTAGAFAQSANLLLVSRVFEGMGFLAVAVAVPDLLNSVVAQDQRNFVFGLWGCYMPTGTALMLVVGPLLPQFGWRHLWLAAATIAALYATAAAWILRTLPVEKRADTDMRSFLRESGAVLRDPACVLSAAAFGLYTFQYFAVASFLPVLFVSAMHLNLAAASLFTTVAVVANACGNVSAAAMLRAGVPPWANMLAALAGFAVIAPLIFDVGFPPPFVALVAALVLGIGGLAPASIFAAIPHFAGRRGLITPTVGLVQQASNLGQFAGPMATGLVVARFGWPAASAVLIPAAVIGIAVVLTVRRTMDFNYDGGEQAPVA